MAAKKSAVGVLKTFFGYKPAEGISPESPIEFASLTYEKQVMAGGLKGFLAEVKRLSEAEKLELAQLAAVELGLSQDEVEFPLV